MPRSGINWMPESASGTVHDATFDTVYDASSTFYCSLLFCFFQTNLRYFPTVHHRRGGSTPNHASKV
jgi:hypothetical protein